MSGPRDASPPPPPASPTGALAGGGGEATGALAGGGGEATGALVGGEGTAPLIGGEGTGALIGGEGTAPLIGGEGTAPLVGGEVGTSAGPTAVAMGSLPPAAPAASRRLPTANAAIPSSPLTGGSVAAPAGDGVAAPARHPVAGPFLGSPARATAEHYELGDEIARGGMGRILAAVDRRLGREVALKTVLVGAPVLRRRFEREIKITARLQHPGIVPVYEAGVLPDGEPFYAMKRVHGRSLDVLIAEARTLEARLALVPSVIAVAQALAYAHRRGVIHRDLKPANVLVGEFGETVVIDWGLAKMLEGDDAEAQAELSLAGVSQPLDGVNALLDARPVLGTPAYMPPEQALGRRVDARADVYAIGAILFHVLSGERPYTGASASEVVNRLLDGKPDPLARDFDCPDDLAAILRRAMARDPADRYPTAGELADDLTRFETGQLVGAHRYTRRELVGRWARRHRTGVAVFATLALVATVAGTVGVRRVLAERAVAQHQRMAAEELVSFVLRDLHDRLGAAGRLELLDQVGARVEKYYEVLADADAEGSTSDAQRARAIEIRGDVQRAKGNLDGALEAYLGSLAIRLQHTVVAPADRTGRVALARSIGRIAELELERGRFEVAVGALEGNLAILGRLAAGSPDDEAIARQLAQGHARHGDVLLARGQDDAALAAYRRAQEALAPLAGARPEDPSLRRGLARGHIRIGRTELERGRLAEALVALRQAVGHYEPLLAADPRNAELQHDAATLFSLIGRAELERGELPAARAAYRRSELVAEELTRGDPDNAAWQRDLVDVLHGLADLALAEGRREEADAAYARALAIARRLAGRDADDVKARQHLADVLAQIGAAALRGGDPRAALRPFREARDVRLALVERDGTNGGWRRELAAAHDDVGRAELALGDHHSARQSFAAARDLRDALAAEAPADARRAAEALRSRRHLAEVLLVEGSVAPAIAELAAAVKQGRSLASRHADGADLRRELVELGLALARAHLRRGEATLAERELRTTVADAEAAHGEARGAAADALLAAEASLALGELLAAQRGAGREAAERFKRAQALLDRLAERGPLPPAGRALRERIEAAARAEPAADVPASGEGGRAEEAPAAGGAGRAGKEGR